MDEQVDVPGITERMVAIPGLNVHVVEAGQGDPTGQGEPTGEGYSMGQGEPILLLHGFPQSSRAYAHVIPLLAGRARVIAADMRGAGQTEAAADGYDLPTLSQDILGLLDALGLERAAIVAHDWSALAAFEVCLNQPERVTRLVSIAVPAPYLRINAKVMGRMVAAMPHLWFQYVVAMPGLGPRLLSRGRQRLARWTLRHFEVQPIPDADVAAYLATLRDPRRARAASALYRRVIIPAFQNMIRGKYRGRALRTPTLVLFGEDDALIPREALEASPDEAPDLTIDFVPGAGHYAVDDAPAEIARRVAEFVGV